MGPAELPSPPRPEHRPLSTAWAVVGVITGSLFLIVPGVLALRSMLRWRRGSIDRPTFAWVCAWVGVPLLAFAAVSAWALYSLPLVSDDFSDPTSGWPSAEGPGHSAGYVDGTYRIVLSGDRHQASFLTWNEGNMPNVAVETDVTLRSGDAAMAQVGVGCFDADGVGYVFVVGPGSTFETFAPLSPTRRSCDAA